MSVHGKNTVVCLDGVNLTGVLNSAEIAASLEMADSTVFGSTWKTGIAGLYGATGTFGGFYDPATSNLPALITSPAFGVLTVCPGGAVLGDRARMLQVLESNFTKSSPVGGIVAISWTVTSSGGVAFGDVLHAPSAVTDTTTGPDRDDASASATGWTAHLHVTAVSAGSWVIKLQDAATNDWADVTGGAFTAATGATGERLVSAAATTALRRHVRYVATRTGGAGTDTCTFLLSYARSL